jgi:hypothetical protein
MGMTPTPYWHAGAVYLPAYPPLYGRAADMHSAVRSLIEQEPGTWVPVVLHWEWEREDNFRAMSTLLELLAGYASPWSAFMAAVRAASAV